MLLLLLLFNASLNVGLFNDSEWFAPELRKFSRTFYIAVGTSKINTSHVLWLTTLGEMLLSLLTISR